MMLGVLPGPASATPPDAAADHTLTLVTGDQVLLRQGKPVSVRAAEGREHVSFTAYTSKGRNHVVPTDVLDLVATGRVDQRLFDITTLLEFGYDDANRSSVPLIVTGQDGAPAAARTAGAVELAAVDGVAVEADRHGRLWRSLTTGDHAKSTAAGVTRIWLDGKRKPVLDTSVPQVGAPTMWEAGYRGAGTTVAVIDSGVDEQHPDLAGREIAEKNFTDQPDNVDSNGHGTHVASTIAGTGATSDGKYRGVAPEASILDVKVLDASAGGQDSQIIQGMQWAAEQGATIANMSLGAWDGPETDPLEEAVTTLSAQYDILFVIGAGNDHPYGHINSPGSAEAALTVGAVDKQDALAPFSSRGPVTGSNAVKPDITAPGVSIVAAKTTAGTGENPGYVAISGTSMATPHVAGAAALMAQQHPDWHGQQIKGALMASAAPNPDLNPHEQGTGRLDLTKAVHQTVYSAQSSLNFGTASFPHDDDPKVTRTITYHNLADEDVTLTLSVDGARTLEGTPAPQGFFTLSADRVLVPAGGTASVDVTADTAVATEANGHYTATVVATGPVAGTTVRTPLTVYREIEVHNLTVKFLDHSGDPLESGYARLTGPDGYPTWLVGTDGTSVSRLPKAKYTIDVITTTEDQRLTFLVAPNVVLDKDTTVVMDLSTAKPVAVRPEAETETEKIQEDVGYALRTQDGWSVTTSVFYSPETIYTGQVGAPGAKDDFVSKVSSQWLAPDGTFYGLSYVSEGAMFDGLSKIVKHAELAKVQVRVGTQAGAVDGVRTLLPVPTGLGQLWDPHNSYPFSWGARTDLKLPAKRTEYLTTQQDGVSWIDLTQVTDVWLQGSQPRTYAPGRKYTEQYGYAPFGPSMPNTGESSVFRVNNQLWLMPTLFGDSSGGDGNPAIGSGASQNLKLYSGGTLLAEGESVLLAEVPKEEATYRLVADATRPAQVGLSTAVHAEWTFTSKSVPGDPHVPLDLSAIRFNPRLDNHNSAPADGKVHLMPVQLQQNPTGALSTPKTLTVDVSYDEGRTWVKAKVRPDMTVEVRHPAAATGVSIRATATGANNWPIRHTIINAYKLRSPA
jgi:subtilisin family serine protease